MKTSSNLLRVAGLGLGFTASVLLSATAFAGPGVQFWQNTGKTTAVAVPGCPASRITAVTSMQPSWINGRGPLAATPAGTARICTTCPVETVATKGLPNGRGPVARVETPSAGNHYCASTACDSASQ